MTSSTRKPFLFLVLFATILTCSLTILENEDLTKLSLIRSLTTGVLDLLDHLRDSHGGTLNEVLTLLLERVKLHNVTEEEAHAITVAIEFIDDPKTQEILDIIGGVVSEMSMDELLSAAFGPLEEGDFTKSDGLPEIEFPGDNRTYVISQLDMMIPEEEMKRERRMKRKAVIDEERLLWKSAIVPYHIHEDQFSSAERHLIKNAMDHWELYTCLEFRERLPSDFNSVLIHGNGSGCLSNAGQIGGTQHLVLGKGCKMLHIIIHEIGHALGLYHEHTRRDRDKYVEIMWGNIAGVRVYEDFRMRPNKHRLEDIIPYDFTSVMHYGTYYWSKKVDGKKLATIRTREESYQDVIGKAKGASFIDIKTISLLYKCSDGCKEKKCPGDGFLGKGCKCWCRGQNDGTPVVACTKEVTCSPPPIDMNIYQVFHYETYVQIMTFELDVPSGTKFMVDRADLRCGDAMTLITCYHGFWKLPLPPCEPDPCIINPWWIEEYDINLVTPDLVITDLLSVNVTHGNSINLTCKSEPSRQQILECSYGNWTKQSVPCPETGGRCLVPDSSNIYILLEGTVKTDDTVKHGDTVQAMCNPDLTLSLSYADYEDVFETNLTCSDGRWIGDMPICPQPAVGCPEVQHGQMHASLLAYNVTCDSGYRLETERDRFQCERNGTWFPITPECIPNDCVIPDHSKYKATIKNSDGVILSESSVVKSGQTIDFECRSGYVPGKLRLTCNAESWDTADGQLPLCKAVFCSSPPPVQNSSYAPHFRRYRFGDIVKINKCKGNLETVGPPERRIECLANGSWSDSFLCRTFCDGGQIEEVEFKNMIVRARAKTYTHIPTVEKCRKKCIRETRFLCQSYLFGFDFETRRWICQHFRVNPSKNRNILEYKQIRYVFARNCIE